MAYEALIYEKQDHIALITLNRPERLNALNKQLQGEVNEACREARNDDDVRTVIFTGAGRGFCSGADISGQRPPEGQEATPPQNELLDEMGWVGALATSVYHLDKPVIAAMNGVCAGAGMSLALACDMRVGSENARFKTVFLERNLSPDSGMSWFLPRIIGYSRAVDLILTSRDVGADEAYRLGLLDRLVPHAELLQAASDIAGEMTRWPPVASRAAKRVTQQNLNKTLEDGLRNEIHHLRFGRGAVNDARESVMARRERREPKYTGT
ncbi:MAG: enoyl-CoA hydratase/isomerase family protein [Dehalococcoidia bacterium]